MALAFKPLTEQQLSALSQQQLNDYFSSMRLAAHKYAPDIWMEDVLKAELWSGQREICRSVAKHRRTAVHACNDSGKSYTAGGIATWWIENHPIDQVFVLTTAPLTDQVDILWREINRCHSKGELVGRTNLTDWYVKTPDGKEELIALGRKPSDHSVTGFQGRHEKYILVIVDESSGIADNIWKGVNKILTNKHAKVLAIGNADDPNSYFAQTICKPNSIWNVIHIDGFNTPNFTGEPVSEHLSDVLLSKQAEADFRAEYGVNDPFYISAVRGKFPLDSADGMIPFSWLQECRKVQGVEGFRQIGIDVGGGGDETVLRLRSGTIAKERWGFRSADPMASVGEMIEIIKQTKAERVCIDAIGVGWGIAGRLQELADEGEILCEVLGVNVGENAWSAEEAAIKCPRCDKVPGGERKCPKCRFVNLKSQIWWEIGREKSRQRLWDLRAVEDQCISELVAHGKKKDSQNRVAVESKDDVRAKIKRSPDNADALLLAFYEPPPVRGEKKRPRMTFRG